MNHRQRGWLQMQSLSKTGLFKENGNKYYKVKNSWSANYGYEGYWYCSEPYVRLHTMFFTLNKEGLTSEIKTKLELK